MHIPKIEMRILSLSYPPLGEYAIPLRYCVLQRVHSIAKPGNYKLRRLKTVQN